MSASPGAVTRWVVLGLLLATLLTLPRRPGHLHPEDRP
jgi:hypothetical protein